MTSFSNSTGSIPFPFNTCQDPSIVSGMSRERKPPAARSPLGSLLRERRKAANHTQETLAEAIGISQETVSAIERGSSLDPRLATFQALAQELNMDVGEFVLAAEMAKSKTIARQIARVAEEQATHERRSRESLIQTAFPQLGAESVSSLIRFANYLQSQEGGKHRVAEKPPLKEPA